MEADRLSALHLLRILDTPPEERFDRLTRVAAALFDAPISLVTLIDSERQWFKSCIGLDKREDDATQHPVSTTRSSPTRWPPGARARRASAPSSRTRRSA